MALTRFLVALLSVLVFSEFKDSIRPAAPAEYVA